MKNFLKTNRTVTCSVAMILLTNTLHAYSPSTTLATQGNGIGTAIVGGTTMTAGTNDLSSISLGLSAIEGTGFTTATDTLHAIAVSGANSLTAIAGTDFSTIPALCSLIAIAKQAALTQVISAASNAALTCNLVGATNAAAFNTAMQTLFNNLTTAELDPANAAIATVLENINTALAVDITAGTITSPYVYQVISAALDQLDVAVNNWIAFYPA